MGRTRRFPRASSPGGDAKLPYALQVIEQTQNVVEVMAVAQRSECAVRAQPRRFDSKQFCFSVDKSDRNLRSMGEKFKVNRSLHVSPPTFWRYQDGSNQKRQPHDPSRQPQAGAGQPASANYPASFC
ncbi:hypothetical protein THICB2_840004 [Thiomonas sp. CB2]|nr:hypothetical protein THICB2_840004 [Thiomonas sp. CB2]VDY06187.1 protein of unknown function [Thiomonas sp. Bio17B3]VDY10517.1 protein of unknown function [Thiomonas sp. Sup16B3]VDY14451.1 conserved protein of unknown function [Thiomonas sp. OC7]VDY16362.1 protein of unknown function [Thiomonas sp. CB2]